MINLVIAGDSIDKQTALNEIQPHVSVELGVEKVIKMQVGSHYLLAKSVAGKNELLKDLVGLQKGDDLIIFHADGSKIVFADYYLFLYT